MSPILIGTFAMLSAWGRWGRGSNLGLPTLSPMFGERALKSPLYGEENPDPGVMAVDAIVCRLEPKDRSIVIRKFQHRWTVREFMREYHWSFTRLKREEEQAIWAVHIELGNG